MFLLFKSTVFHCLTEVNLKETHSYKGVYFLLFRNFSKMNSVDCNTKHSLKTLNVDSIAGYEN